MQALAASPGGQDRLAVVSNAIKRDHQSI